jgi:uncharacterized protein YjbI with pentapeptide repeats
MGNLCFLEINLMADHHILTLILPLFDKNTPQNVKNFIKTNLGNVNLQNAHLRDIDLSYADLRGADFCGADLSFANLRCADFCGADLRDADLTGAKITPEQLASAITE